MVGRTVQKEFLIQDEFHLCTFKPLAAVAAWPLRYVLCFFSKNMLLLLLTAQEYKSRAAAAAAQAAAAAGRAQKAPKAGSSKPGKGAVQNGTAATK